MQKVAGFGWLGPIPMFKHAFCSSCPALQYDPGMKFFHRVVPELHIGDKFHFNALTMIGLSYKLMTTLYP